jgi:hypothetical protein
MPVPIDWERHVFRAIIVPRFFVMIKYQSQWCIICCFLVGRYYQACDKRLSPVNARPIPSQDHWILSKATGTRTNKMEIYTFYQRDRSNSIHLLGSSRYVSLAEQSTAHTFPLLSNAIPMAFRRPSVHLTGKVNESQNVLIPALPRSESTFCSTPSEHLQEILSFDKDRVWRLWLAMEGIF